MQIRRFVACGMLAVGAAAAACSPGEEAQPSKSLIISPANSTAAITADPSYPSSIALCDITVAVGLQGAGIADKAIVQVGVVELRAGGVSVPIGGHFEGAEVTNVASFTVKSLYAWSATNEKIATLCGKNNPTLHVEVQSAGYTKATGDFPVTLKCLPDRRAGVLATKPLGSNPSDRPCASTTQTTAGTDVSKFGWDVGGHLEAEEFAGQRTVYQRDAEGHVVKRDKIDIINGLFVSRTTFTYQGSRVASITSDNFEQSTSTSVVWASDLAAQAGKTSFSLSPDGKKLTMVSGNGENHVATFEKPITLTDRITNSAIENALVFHAITEEVTSPSGKGFTETFEYSNGKIIGDTVTAGGQEVSKTTWAYSCP